MAGSVEAIKSLDDFVLQLVVSDMECGLVCSCLNQLFLPSPPLPREESFLFVPSEWECLMRCFGLNYGLFRFSLFYFEVGTIWFRSVSVC